MSDTAQRIADLSPEKRALLSLRLKELQTPAPQTIPRRDESAPLILSFGQQRLWFLDQLRPNQPFYNVHNALRLQGQLDVATLERSLNEIIRRHEILRTTFATQNEQPLQVIAPAPALTLPLKDLGELSEDERASQVRRLAAEQAREPFDLARGPLLRALLLRVGPKEHVLLLTLHHIVSDLWSLRVLMRELAALYASFVRGDPSPLPELPIQYADFAQWQRQWLQGEVLTSQLSYWKRQLEGAPALLNLPTDRPRPAIQTSRGAMQTLAFSPRLIKALQALSQQEGVTLFMTLLAAFKTLLYRYTGQPDILVGTPVAGRKFSETETLIGFFLNTLVLRTDLAGDPSFRELLDRVRETALGAYAHQDLPFEKLVEELVPERSLSYTPLFQVMFALQNVPIPSQEFAGLTMRLLEIDAGTARFDLSLNLEMQEKRTAALVYNADLFDEATVGRMLGHYQTLLESIVADPERRLSRLRLLPDAERRQLLVGWNDSRRDYALDLCLHQLFETQAQRTPDATAVIAGERELDYRALNRQANQLAHYLQSLGAGPDVPVGIFMERSLEMVVGLLGILKAGGAYLPLEPTHPQERLAFVLEQAQVPIVLTHEGLGERLPAYLSIRSPVVVRLDADWPVIARESQETPASGVTPLNLAYGIYTSGSTGRPKGVLIPHRGVVNRLLWMQELLQLNADDRILHKTPLVFDVSVPELFLPLLNGGCLVLARPRGHWDSAYLVELMAEKRVTLAHFVPSMLNVFVEQQGLEACAPWLKYVWCGGETLPWELQARFFARLQAQLFNGYGPTETSVGVTVWPCQRESDKQVIPIGRPVANTQIYLLDGHLNPVPVGVPGELHVGGAGVGRGYLCRPALTGERFVPHPFAPQEGTGEGARLYKTGDLARYSLSGDIEFLGRTDHQIKIRGFRVELGEIAAVLAEHLAVRQAVVLAREGVSEVSVSLPTDKHRSTEAHERLVAYYVPEQPYTPSGGELRGFLKQKLPDYMVPSAYVPLENLPYLASGKINRDALPSPDASHLASDASFVAPRNEMEQTLADIWKEVLEVDQVGVHDNFFDLGGHSLLLVMVRGQLQEKTGRDVPIADLFEYPTISALAQHLSQEGAAQPGFEDLYERASQQRAAMEQQMQLGQQRESQDV